MTLITSPTPRAHFFSFNSLSSGRLSPIWAFHPTTGVTDAQALPVAQTILLGSMLVYPTFSGTAPPVCHTQPALLPPKSFVSTRDMSLCQLLKPETQQALLTPLDHNLTSMGVDPSNKLDFCLSRVSPDRTLLRAHVHEVKFSPEVYRVDLARMSNNSDSIILRRRKGLRQLGVSKLAP